MSVRIPTTMNRHKDLGWKKFRKDEGSKPAAPKPDSAVGESAQPGACFFLEMTTLTPEQARSIDPDGKLRRLD